MKVVILFFFIFYDKIQNCQETINRISLFFFVWFIILDMYVIYVYSDFCFGKYSEDVCNVFVGDLYFVVIKKKCFFVFRQRGFSLNGCGVIFIVKK